MMKPIRILLVSNWFPPVVSGSSTYAQSLAQALRGRGHEVEVVTLDWGEEYRPSSGLGFPVHCFPVIKVPKLPTFYNMRLMGFAFTPQNYKRLKSLIREYRPDILHHVNHIFDTNFLSTLAAKRSGIPIVGSITTPIQHENPWAQRVFTFLDRVTVGWFGVRRWDGIVSLDRNVHDYVGHVYGNQTQKRSRVIPFGVRLDLAEHYRDDGQERSKRPQILMVGHIHPFRNPVQLVRSMTHILKEIPNAHLVLAGRIDLEEPVKVARQLGLGPEQVEFQGGTAHDEVIRLMKTSHVFAHWLTGPYRALGTASMESMLCETPVVTDLRDDLFGENKLRNGENIVLINSKNPESIADAILRLLRDANLRKRIGAAGRQFVLKHLSWEGIAEQMEDFYVQIRKK